MIQTRHFQRSVRNLLLLLVIVSIAWSSCAKRRIGEPADLLEGLPPDLVRFLSLEDDSSRTRYGRAVGLVSLNSYLNALYSKLNGLPPDRYDRDAPVLVGHLFAVTRVMRSEYDYAYPYADVENIQSMPLVKWKEIYSLRLRETELFWDKDSTDEEKISEIREIRDRLEQLGDRVYVLIADYHISSLYLRMGDAGSSIPLIRESVRAFEREGQLVMLCQALGALGNYYDSIGEIDSMIICYEKALDTASRIRHPIQAARISAFYAGHYILEGRLGLGHELLYEAMEKCREYKGGSLERRYIHSTMEFYSELECWDLVRVLLDRAEVLQRLYADDRDLYYYYVEFYSRRVHEIQARLAMAVGEVEKGDAIFDRIEDENVGHFHPSDQIRIYFYWASGLLDNGRLRKAEEICRKGVEYSQRANIEDWEAKLLLLRARIGYAKGDVEAAVSALRQFSELAADFEQSLYKEIIFGDALMGRLQLESGNIEEAFSHLISGIDRFVDYVTTRDASAHSYLLFENFEDLKSLFHDLVAYSPSLGYGVELYWRGFYRRLGEESRRSRGDSASAARTGDESGTRSLERSEDLVDSVRVLSERVLARIVGQGAIHCSYAVHGDEVWCWVASSGRIERETLEISVKDLRELVSGTLEMLAAPRGGDHLMIPSELTERLRLLAQIMLPGELLRPPAGNAHGLVYITAGGFLGLVPFEVYNIGGRGEYVPLLENHDVVYLRHADSDSDGGGCRSGVVLVNTEPVTTVRNKRIFAEHLPEIVSEGDILAEADANAVKLVGKEATKTNLLSLWEDVSYIYFATHIVHDSEVPYLVHIPLAEPGEDAGISMRYLDATDIQAADFSRCRLVVLSGCSSGVPYCGSAAAGPALGDIFLDSGVGAVIQTNWSVEDASAKNLMGSFIRSWCEGGLSPSEALCGVRRDAMRDDGGFRHPLLWASYSIKARSLQ